MKPDDILRLAAETPCSPTTVRRYLEGRDKVTERKREAIEAAMKRLKLKLAASS
jgi:DNA-binding LacI/PurR family transcriptional regulator